MAKLKTTESDADVAAFLASVENRGRAEDAAAAAEIMARVTGEPARLWGDAIIGFGRFTYRRADGGAHEWFLTGVSPRKAALSVHLMDGTASHADALDRLGPHRRAVSCLYLGRLAKIDMAVLEEIVTASVDAVRARVNH